MVVEENISVSRSSLVSLSEPSLRKKSVMSAAIAGVALLVGIGVMATFGAWADIFRIVMYDDEASHIMLVPIVFIWLAWTCRHKCRDVAIAPSFYGVAMILAGWGLWATGYIQGFQVAWHLGAIVIVVGSVVTVVGTELLRRLWPAFLVLVFLIPTPGFIRQPVALILQNLSAQMTEHVMLLLGQKIDRLGNILIINGREVGVAEACNGMRMITMLVLVCYVFIFVNPLQNWARILLIFASGPLAVLCNMLRLVPTVYAYGYMESGTAERIHDALGWIMVVAAYLMLMGVVRILRWLMLPVYKKNTSHPPKHLRSPASKSKRQSYGGPWLPVAVGFLCLVGVFVHGETFPTSKNAVAYHDAVRESALNLPRRIGEWDSVDTEVPPAAIALLRPNIMISRQYTHVGTRRTFSLILVQCGDVRDMAGHYPPICYPSAGWGSDAKEALHYKLKNMSIDGMSYAFSRLTGASSTVIYISNFMLLPDGRTVLDMREMRKKTGSYVDRAFGAAQIQLVFSQNWTKEERDALAQEVLVEIEPLLELILEGKDTVS